MTIGILTYQFAINYGAQMQCYALYNILKDKGHEVVVINYTPHKINNLRLNDIRQAARQLKESFDWEHLQTACHILTHSPGMRKSFHRFQNRYLQIGPYCSTPQEIVTKYPQLDAMIVGSDQVWAPAHHKTSVYFLNFNPPFEGLKIAYAPSMGPNPEELDKNYVKKLLTGYIAVSVRERRTKDFLERNGIYSNVSLVLDPTMLLDDRDYDSLIDKEPIIKGKYLFYYTPGGIRPEFLKEALYIGDKLGLPVVYDNFYHRKDIKDYCNIYAYPETGPSEFLNLVKNATAVCGASFHLMVFSILFQKNFYCMNGDIDSRMNNLMVSMGLEDRIWSIINKERNILDETVYSDLFKDNIDKFRKQSTDFLNESLASRF